MTVRQLLPMLAAVGLFVAIPLQAAAPTPMGTTWTYQGRLTDGGSPANGTYDLRFTLYDSTGFAIGGPDVVNDEPVVNGLFTVELDFGSVFTGQAASLEIGVRPGASTGDFMILSPRQELRPAPYALYALSAPGSSGLTLPYEGTLTGYEEGTHALDIENDAPESSTLRGIATGTDGIGLRGFSSGTYGRGVYTGATGSDGIGMYAYAGTDALTAVYGRATGSPPQGEHNTGGHFLAFESGSVGVLGEGDLGVHGVSIGGTGVRGETDDSGEYGVAGVNNGTIGNAIGVYGESATASGFGGYFLGRGYFSNNVGIGTASPGSPLTVAGLIESISGGFKFPDGTIQTTAGGGGGGESLWQQNGSEIYYNAANVGVGVTDPQATLHVAGGNWNVGTTEGDFKIGNSTYRLKMGVGLSGGETGEARIYAGGPSSELILGANGSERLRITGTQTDITGTVEMDGFRLTNAPAAGFVLTSDSSGNGTWQTPTGGGGGDFSLPYSGSVNNAGAAFSITNSGLGKAVEGVVGADSALYGWGYGPYSIGVEAMGGGMDTDHPALRAENTHPSGVALTATNNSSNASAIFTNTGSGELIQCYGGLTGGNPVFEVRNNSVYIEGDAEEATTLTARAHGGTARAIYAVNDGALPTIEVSNIGSGDLFKAKSGATTVFRVHNDGAIELDSNGSGDLITASSGGTEVFSVENDGRTVVSVLHLTGGADLAEQFDVVESSAEPGTVVEIDPDHPGKMRIARGAYNRRVAGVISGANELSAGMILGDMPGADGAKPIALSGRVWVHCDATQHAVEPGDMLTTADRPGHAMAVTDFERAHGTVIGKAMSQLDKGKTGMVLVLVNLQ